jgi:hypothetical protein
MGINYKGSQSQTKRAIVPLEEEEYLKDMVYGFTLNSLHHSSTCIHSNFNFIWNFIPRIDKWTRMNEEMCLRLFVAISTCL